MDRTGSLDRRAHRSPSGREASRRSEASQGRFAWLVGYVLLTGFLCAGFLLMGLSIPVSSAYYVEVEGRPVLVTPGMSAGKIATERSLTPNAGARLDIAGNVLNPGAGEAGQITVNGKPAGLESLLAEGSVVQLVRGNDHQEPLKSKVETIPYESRRVGSGPVVALAQAGVDGQMEVRYGEWSKRRASEIVRKAPVAAVIRHTSAAAAGQKAVALTFDDGPSKYTQLVLDELAKKHVKATFFMLGKNAAANPGLVAAVRAAGHEIATHGYSHPDLTKLSVADIDKEIETSLSVLGSAHFLRPPYGSYNAQVVARASAAGLKLVLWDVDTLDWKHQDVTWILNQVKAETKAGAVILMHDGGGNRSQTAASLPRVIDWLLEQGYAVTTVGQLYGAGRSA